LINNLAELINDTNGISVAKKFVNGNKSVEIRSQILNLILKKGINIIQNSFGNYMIQHIFALWGPVVCKGIINIIKANVMSLSIQKFSSNVVEKCFEFADYVRKLFLKL